MTATRLVPGARGTAQATNVEKLRLTAQKLREFGVVTSMPQGPLS